MNGEEKIRFTPGRLDRCVSGLRSGAAELKGA